MEVVANERLHHRDLNFEFFPTVFLLLDILKKHALDLGFDLKQDFSQKNIGIF